MMRLVSMALSTFAVAAMLAPARADAAPSHTCERVDDELVLVDGMLDDWRGSRYRQLGSGDDLAVRIRCAYDSRRLYVSVSVRDQRILRTRRARRRSEDNAQLRIGRGKRALALRAFPGNDDVRGTIRLRRRKLPGWMEAAETLQTYGWSMEVGVPLSRIPGWSRSAGHVGLAFAYHDADRATAQAIEDTRRWKGRLRFSDKVALMRSFLRATGLSRSDLRHDTMANLDGKGAAERVVGGGRVIGVLGDRFTYMSLPVSGGSDVKEVRTVDLAGDGRDAIVVRYRQHGGGGSRDIVGVWYVDGKGAFSRVLAFEVRKELGGKVLENDWKLVRRGRFREGRRSRRGRDILVRAGDVRGWDEDSYEEIPADDVQPILMPWADRTSVVYWFEGGEAHAAEPRGVR